MGWDHAFGPGSARSQLSNGDLQLGTHRVYTPAHERHGRCGRVTRSAWHSCVDTTLRALGATTHQQTGRNTDTAHTGNTRALGPTPRICQQLLRNACTKPTPPEEANPSTNPEGINCGGASQASAEYQGKSRCSERRLTHFEVCSVAQRHAWPQARTTTAGEKHGRTNMPSTRDVGGRPLTPCRCTIS